MSILIRNFTQVHPFHLVSPSPWPLNSSISLLALTMSGVLKMHNYAFSYHLVYISFVALILSMSFWFKDVISEGTHMGDHTAAVQRGLSIGVGLFIVSEALFFLAIFWTFFHSSLAPNIEIGAHWPPNGIESINAFELPLLNTIILLASGITLTYSHHYLIDGIRSKALYGLIITVILAALFTGLQGKEYAVSSFSISDGSYGSCFYFGTGFHGFHVIIGTIFLSVGLGRLVLYHLSESHHLGYEASILYWHFVDVVWLFLFISVYYWGS